MINPDLLKKGLIALFFLFAALCLRAQTEILSKSWTGTDEINVLDIEADTKGAIYFLANFKGELNFGGQKLKARGNRDCLLAKLDENGNVQWFRMLSSSGDLHGQISIDQQGSIAVVGTFSGSLGVGDMQVETDAKKAMFFVVFNAEGIPKGFRKTGEMPGGAMKDVEFDPKGNVLVTGTYADSLRAGSIVLTGKGFENLFLLKLGHEGKVLWGHSGAAIGRSEKDSIWGGMESVGLDICTGPDGRIYLAGLADIMAGALPMEDHEYGKTWWRGGAYLACFDENGQKIWLRHFWGFQAFGNAVLADAQGYAYMAGGFTGIMNFDAKRLKTLGGESQYFLARFDPEGNLDWVRMPAENRQDRARYSVSKLRPGPEGGVLVSGTQRSDAKGSQGPGTAPGDSLFFLSYDSSGVAARHFAIEHKMEFVVRALAEPHLYLIGNPSAKLQHDPRDPKTVVLRKFSLDF